MRTGNEALVEWLVGQVLVVLLEMLFRGADKLNGCELVSAFQISHECLPYWASEPIDIPTLLESGDDVPNESTLPETGLAFFFSFWLPKRQAELHERQLAYLDAIWLDSNESDDKN